MKDAYLLKGLSKDSVRLVYDENNIFVRKTAQNFTNSQRLKEQYNLIKNWKEVYIKVPKLFKSGINHKSKFYFDMEFINEPSLSHIFNYASHDNNIRSRKAFLILASYFERQFDSQLLPNKHQILYRINEKLKLLVIFFNNLKNYKIDEKVFKVLNKYIEHLNSLDLSSSWDSCKNIQYSIHGDLTFSNVLMSRNDLYFIDLNRHFLGNTILSDVSKLLFDLDFCLSIKLENNNLDVDISILNYFSKIKKNIINMSTLNIDYYLDIKDLLLIIEALRVLQYVFKNNFQLTENLHAYIIDKSDAISKKNILCQL